MGGIVRVVDRNRNLEIVTCYKLRVIQLICFFSRNHPTDLYVCGIEMMRISMLKYE